MTNQCRSRENQGYGEAIQKNNITFCACNKIGHIAKYCRNKNPPIANGNLDDKEKTKVQDIKRQHERRWVQKSETQSTNQPVEQIGSKSKVGTSIGK